MKTILLVSANGEILDNVPRYLSFLGYKVKTASNAEEAFRLAGPGLPVDLLISELKIASASGLGKNIREWLKKPDLPIIGIAGVNDDFTVEDLFMSVVKMPFKLKALGQEVSRFLPML